MTKANEAVQKDETTLLGGRVRLMQFAHGLRAGLDAVMVAAACPAKEGQRVLDLGCGTGAAGLCVRARVDVALTGVDIQSELVALAQESALLNGWDAEFIAGDLRDKGVVASDMFDHAICNPPYMQAGAWYDTPDKVRSKQLGKQDGDATLAAWMDTLYRAVRPGGSVSVIHRADHADKIIQAFGPRFGGMELWTLHPHDGEAAGRIVIRALKARKSPVKIHPGIVLHRQEGGWTETAEGILSHLHGLPSV